MKTKISLTFISLILCATLSAQVGIGTVTPDPSAILDMDASDKGILVPRVSLPDITTTQLDGTNTAAEGLLIWNTNASTTGGDGVGFYAFNGTSWEKLSVGISEDIDWYEEGTTNGPNDINDNIFTNGAVGINTNADVTRQLNVAASPDANYGGYFSNTSTLAGTKYGIQNYVTTGNIEFKYGIRNEIGQPGDEGRSVGTQNILNGDSSTNLYGTDNTFLGTDGGTQVGEVNRFQGTSDANAYGDYNIVDYEGVGLLHGSFTQMLGSAANQKVAYWANIANGDGLQVGYYTGYSGTGNGGQYGAWYVNTSEGTGAHIGARNDMAGIGTGYQAGVYNTLTNTSDGTHDGMQNRITGDGNGLHRGVLNFLNNNGTGQHEGTTNHLLGTGDGHQLATLNLVDNTGDGIHDGVNNQIRGDGNGLHRGVLNYIDNDGTGQHEGTTNHLRGIGGGIQLGVYSIIDNSGDGNHWGTYNQLSGSGTGVHEGTVNFLSGVGTGVQIGTRNRLTGTSDTFMSGTTNELLSNGNGEHRGVSQVLSGTGTGNQSGMVNFMTNTGGGEHHGVYGQFSGDASNSYGMYNVLSGTVANRARGVFNAFSGTSGTQSGVYNTFSAGQAAMIGSENYFTSDGGSGYGTYMFFAETSNANQYGHYVTYVSTSAGTGNKYGYYANYNAATTGTPIGFYANVPNTNGFAALLDGAVVANDSGRNVDFRIETGNRTHTLYADGNNDLIRFGTTAGATVNNGNVVNGYTLSYVADFDMGALGGTTIGVGSAEYLMDGGSNISRISGTFTPVSDNTTDLGSPTYRWDDVYATNGVIQTSDIRLKTNIAQLDYGLAEILKLKPISYQWKEQKLANEVKLGFSAQDLLEVIPEVVKTHDVVFNEDEKTTKTVENERLGVNYSDIIPVLTKAIQEQQDLIKKLEIRVENLENQLKR
ncbi:tail fiber domain-containing protein [Marinirhabdus gelatinilytica]|uniref:Endosialidase-like protein n=1 Tax=Marinirhabdus gelatinilytica TaxID=1703343 RepID=A0A370Q7J5_9FLAO|nr:tail fiber domain-containing protein [Marinirhabdus gelatinilytica]RDK84316.1 endosialidase-like protein [Marinirhabdus gelatinilytica]